jgi:hypothetical protein
MPDPEKRRKKLWEVDPSVYILGPKPGFRAHIVGWFRAIGKVALYAMFFAYPLVLPIIGVAFGGLAFWTTLGGSVVVISVILERFGFARTFAERDFPFFKSTLALFGGFLCALGFYLGLFVLQWWILPIIIALVSVALLIALRKEP